MFLGVKVKHKRRFEVAKNQETSLCLSVVVHEVPVRIDKVDDNCVVHNIIVVIVLRIFKCQYGLSLRFPKPISIFSDSYSTP
jgi:hypothetical protein